MTSGAGTEEMADIDTSKPQILLRSEQAGVPRRLTWSSSKSLLFQGLARHAENNLS